MEIGPYKIEKGAFLAPMAGITNPPFRKLCIEMGASLTVTELISSHALHFIASNRKSLRTSLGQKTLAILDRFEGERPLAVQIFGREPCLMEEAARFVESRGADIVDINFGCPARKVVKGGDGAGVALMRDPKTLGKIARDVVGAVSVPVTAKIRSGWSREERNAAYVAKILEDAGVEAICVHARTRDQVHSGPVDFDTLREVVQAVSIPVIGNGGIRNKEDADRMMEETGCRRVAVGQGAKGNPWIFASIKSGANEPDLKDRIETCKRHLDLYVSWVGEKRAAVEMRKHACWYVKGFDGAAALRKKLAKAESSAEFHKLLDEALV